MLKPQSTFQTPIKTQDERQSKKEDVLELEDEDMSIASPTAAGKRAKKMIRKEEAERRRGVHVQLKG